MCMRVAVMQLIRACCAPSPGQVARQGRRSRGQLQGSHWYAMTRWEALLHGSAQAQQGRCCPCLKPRQLLKLGPNPSLDHRATAQGGTSKCLTAYAAPEGRRASQNRLPLRLPILDTKSTCSGSQVSRFVERTWSSRGELT